MKQSVQERVIEIIAAGQVLVDVVGQAIEEIVFFAARPIAEMGISRQQLCNIEQSETAPVVVKYIAFLRSKGVDLNALLDRIIVNK